ncbi:MAG: hypothetical protein NTY90_00320 [Candidatus Micrarchaeota archaeon]|nr:hypothetical protein [Candidatus Micrarchaeota archaeon]
MKKTILLAACLAAVFLFGCLAAPQQNAGAGATIAPVVTPTPTPAATPAPTPAPTVVPAQETVVAKNCSADSDCDWTVVTCCPASMGGKWECANEKETSVYNCPADLVCPAVYSSTPMDSCLCVEKSCRGGELNFSQAAKRVEDAVNQVLNQTIALGAAGGARFTLDAAVDYRGITGFYEKRAKYFLKPSPRAVPGGRTIDFMVSLKPASTRWSGAYFPIEQFVDGRIYYVNRGKDAMDNPVDTKAAFSCGDGKFLVAVNDEQSFDQYFNGFWFYDFDKEAWAEIPVKAFVSALMKACPQ